MKIKLLIVAMLGLQVNALVGVDLAREEFEPEFDAPKRLSGGTKRRRNPESMWYGKKEWVFDRRGGNMRLPERAGRGVIAEWVVDEESPRLYSGHVDLWVL